MNKTAEVKNSQLLLQYVKLDFRFQILIHTLKAWNRELSKDPRKKLNNFALSLMLIAYMQSGGYLPNLQAGYRYDSELTRSQIIDKPTD